MVPNEYTEIFIEINIEKSDEAQELLDQAKVFIETVRKSI